MNKHRLLFRARAVLIRSREFGSAMFGLDEFLRQGTGEKSEIMEREI